MFPKDTKGSYYILNVSFMAIIVAIFLYAALYPKNKHPIPALLTKTTGIIPPSKGLSVSFAEIIRGNISTAKKVNPYSVRVFGFFILQLVLRVLISIAVWKGWLTAGKIAVADICIAVTMFAYCFAPMIEFTLKLFAQLIH